MLDIKNIIDEVIQSFRSVYDQRRYFVYKCNFGESITVEGVRSKTNIYITIHEDSNGIIIKIQRFFVNGLSNKRTHMKLVLDSLKILESNYNIKLDSSLNSLIADN